jgi:glycosyltransferase involved in cell wall biosynthesis
MASNGAPPRVLLAIENLSMPRDRRAWPECLALRDAGFEVEAICPRGLDGEDEKEFEVCDGIPIYRYPARPSGGSALGYAREYLSAMWQISRLASKRSRERPFDVVHVGNPPDVLLLALWSLKRHGTRFVFDHHDLAPELYEARFGGRGLARLALRAIERMSFALADVVISANESYRRLAITRGRKHPEDVFVVRNGPDLSRLPTAEADPSLRRGKRHLLTYVGQIEPQDGVDVGIRALALLAKRRQDWHALFVGDGDGLGEAQALAAELGLADRVGFTGWVHDPADVRRIIISSDVCLSPEPKNALNDASTLIKVAEYMASALPVVAFELTETRRTAGRAAAYARPDDLASFAARIDELLDDPVRRERMGAVGRARVERSLGWEYSRRELIEAYRRALPQPGARHA